jgi:hypothetical protein
MASNTGLCDQVAEYMILKSKVSESLNEKNCGIVVNAFACSDRIIEQAIMQARSVVSELNYATQNGIDSTKK